MFSPPGSTYYDNVRPLAYPDSDAVLICFDISRPETLESVLKKVSAASQKCERLMFFQHGLNIKVKQGERKQMDEGSRLFTLLSKLMWTARFILTVWVVLQWVKQVFSIASFCRSSISVFQVIWSPTRTSIGPLFFIYLFFIKDLSLIASSMLNLIIVLDSCKCSQLKYIVRK